MGVGAGGKLCWGCGLHEEYLTDVVGFEGSGICWTLSIQWQASFERWGLTVHDFGAIYELLVLD